ncbi:MAG: 23S rRNA (uracil(1939)-C(5))-methyltransferase RlmD [Aminipila sp.]
MEKGQKVKLIIQDMSNEGQGIGRVEGMAVFVKGAIPGDTVIAEITKVKKNYAFAVTCEIEEPSEYRIDTQCEYAGKCGGCLYSGVSYEGQLAIKENQVREKLTRLGGLQNPKLNPIVGMNSPYNYRNKAQMPISTGGIITRKGGIVENLGECTIGFYKAKSHDVIDCKECLLQSTPVGAVAQAVRGFMRSDNITAYDPKWEKGLMRHLIVKTAHGTGEVMVILVINGKGIPNSAKLVEMLDDAIYNLPPREDGVEYNLESVVVNINKEKTSEIMGKECITIAGKPTILESVGDMEFEVSPLAFYQVNPEQMKVLYDKVLDYADLSGDEYVLDLYCGVGSIGLYCANDMKKKTAGNGKGKVLGIESVKSAVLDANRNAVINGLVNAEFIYGRVEEVLASIVDKEEWEASPLKEKVSAIAKGPISPNVVILDPPRAGCDIATLEAVSKASPDKIVYVSCDPATLARDIKVLSDLGYEFVEGTPVDMFPWTGHVEAIIMMTRA